MKRSREEVELRRSRLADMLAEEGYLPVKELCNRLKISEPTLRRDLSELERKHKIMRTHGGAVMEQYARFPTFAQRKNQHWDAKQKLAARALRFLRPGICCYFDAGTTVAALAEALVRNPLESITVVTPSIPVAEILSETSGIEVFIPGGQLLPQQSVLLGERAEAALSDWRFDVGFFGIQGFDETGIWNTQEPVVRLQKIAARNADAAYYCGDAAKCAKGGAVFLTPWDPKVQLITDASLKRLERAAIPLPNLIL